MPLISLTAAARRAPRARLSLPSIYPRARLTFEAASAGERRGADAAPPFVRLRLNEDQRRSEVGPASRVSEVTRSPSPHEDPLLDEDPAADRTTVFSKPHNSSGNLPHRLMGALMPRCWF